ncbi:unnamed protein product [Leptidea sinapis]|uniref:Uncharacterized protein n=1 Tax=Leptidea sinapis TaxID=189913 RepID=A0A5E4QM66_9NEOP|nr:unnamed protein product [Leptidea sinapis]
MGAKSIPQYTSTMLTRKTLDRKEEAKLQTALIELQKRQDLCAKLITERDGNEREFMNVLDTNQKPKIELSSLHKDYTNIIDDRDRLQKLTSQ